MITGVWSRSHFGPSSAWWDGVTGWEPQSTSEGLTPIDSNLEASNSANRRIEESRLQGSCSPLHSCMWRTDRTTTPDISFGRKIRWAAWRSGPARCSPGRCSRSGRSKGALEEDVLGRWSRRQSGVVVVSWLGVGWFLVKQDNQSSPLPDLHWLVDNDLSSIYCPIGYTLRIKPSCGRYGVCLYWVVRGQASVAALHYKKEISGKFNFFSSIFTTA